MKAEKFPHSRKSSHRQVFGEFWNLRGQHNQGVDGKPTEYAPTATASQEVAQRLASVTGKQGWGREVRAASSVLRVRTRPEDNLRELT